MTEKDSEIVVVQEPKKETNQAEKRVTQNPEHKIVVVAKIVYILHALSILLGIATGASILGAFLFGWPSIAAVVLNYALRSEAKGTFVASHFTWQIQTFWSAAIWSLLVAVIGILLSWVLIGIAIWAIGFMVMGIWVGYRIIRGWIRLSSREEMPV